MSKEKVYRKQCKEKKKHGQKSSKPKSKNIQNKLTE